MNSKIPPSGAPKEGIIEQYCDCTGLAEKMRREMEEYVLSLHGVKEGTKEGYLSMIRLFGLALVKQGKARFKGVNRKVIDVFLSHYRNPDTKNLCIFALRSLFSFLGSQSVIDGLRTYKIQPEQITSSDVLTPEEIVGIANQASRKREMYKVLILTLYESCATCRTGIGVLFSHFEV